MKKNKASKAAAIFVEFTSNKKLGDMSTTYASIEGSCPSSCKWKDTVCYAQTGYVGIVNARMNKGAKGKSAYQISREEAQLMDASFEGKPLNGRVLRLHTAGDCRTKKGALALASATKRWLQRGGGPVYTYTHSWKSIDRKTFGSISVLASIDNAKEAKAAIKKGYAPAMVVDTFPNGDKAFEMDGIKFIACPNQTRGVTCNQCKLCFDDKKLAARNAAIAFSVHGTRKSKFHLKVV